MARISTKKQVPSLSACGKMASARDPVNLFTRTISLLAALPMIGCVLSCFILFKACCVTDFLNFVAWTKTLHVIRERLDKL